MSVTAQSILDFWDSIGDDKVEELMTRARAELSEDDEWMLRRVVLEICNNRPERYYTISVAEVRFAISMVAGSSGFSDHFTGQLARVYRENVALRQLTGAAPE